MAADRTALLLRGVLDLCLLEAVRGEPVYGYEVQTRLSARGLDVAEGTVYPLLGRLLRLELICATTRPSGQRPPRKYYSLTDSGRRYLADETRVWTSLRDDIDAALNLLPISTEEQTA